MRKRGGSGVRTTDEEEGGSGVRTEDMEEVRKWSEDG
jgi:hypothetical protein